MRTDARMARGLGVALVSLFLIVGTAFAANALAGPGGEDYGTPAPATAQTAEPTGTAALLNALETPEPTETADADEPAEATETADADESDEADETREPAETDDSDATDGPDDDSGEDDDSGPGGGGDDDDGSDD